MFKKVFGNLAVDYGLLLFLTVIVAAFSLVGLLKVEADYRLLVGHSFEIERLAAKIQADLLHTENLEEAFLLHLEEEGFESAYEHYVVPHQEFTDSLKEDARRLAELVSASTSETRLDDQKVFKDLAKMDTDIAAYEGDFARLIVLLEERGTTENGLEGDLRQKANKIEELVRAQTDEEGLRLALLELRLAENEYLLHRTREHADRVIFWYHQLFGEIEDSTTIPRHQKSEIEVLLDAYDTEFERLGATDQEILVLLAEIEALYKDVERLAVDIDDIGRHESTQEASLAHSETTLTIRIVTMSIIAVLVLGLGLTLAMSRRLRQMTESDNAENPQKG